VHHKYNAKKKKSYKLKKVLQRVSSFSSSFLEFLNQNFKRSLGYVDKG